MTPRKEKKSSQISILAPFLVLLILLTVFIYIKAPVVQGHLYSGYAYLDHPEPIPGFRSPPCNETANPEFHSLRPYQTSPCGTSNKTYFCWNNYNLLESFSTTWNPFTCTPNGSTWQCNYGQDIEKIYVIDGEGARFPIMGNTEQVTNSQVP
jgi:hypothetical protein